MKSKLAFYAAAAVFMLCLQPLANADDNQALKLQIDILNQRLNELEKRMATLEGLPTIKEENLPDAEPGNSQAIGNWARIKLGMEYAEVRELLGEPTSIRKGSMELWYYTDKGTKGPYVRYLFKRVNDWKGPDKFDQ